MPSRRTLLASILAALLASPAGAQGVTKKERLLLTRERDLRDSSLPRVVVELALITAAQLPVSAFFAGYTLSKFVGPANLPGNAKYNPAYNLPTSYQGNRDLRLGIRLIF